MIDRQTEREIDREREGGKERDKRNRGNERVFEEHFILFHIM